VIFRNSLSSSFHNFQNKNGIIAKTSDRMIALTLDSDFNTTSGTYVKAIRFIYPEVTILKEVYPIYLWIILL